MKAVIDGISVEGTAEEIAEFMRIVGVKEPVQPLPYVFKPEITCECDVRNFALM